MISGFYIILAGFVLGIQHAFDPDHIVAVSNIISDNKNIMRSSFLGISWGIGHTLTLLLAGLLLLVFKLSVPREISLILELLVGLLLVVFGTLTIVNASKARVHSDVHVHGKVRHLHLHDTDNHVHIDKRPFLLGMIHGFAGSAALMLLVLGTVGSVFEGLVYIAFFGLGSIFGMLLATTLISLPFVFTARKISGINVAIRIVAGIIGIVLGGFMIASLILLS